MITSSTSATQGQVIQEEIGEVLNDWNCPSNVASVHMISKTCVLDSGNTPPTDKGVPPSTSSRVEEATNNCFKVYNYSRHQIY
eukprot:753246-Hanusia_phi.AAC.2